MSNHPPSYLNQNQRFVENSGIASSNHFNNDPINNNFDQSLSNYNTQKKSILSLQGVPLSQSSDNFENTNTDEFQQFTKELLSAPEDETILMKYSFYDNQYIFTNKKYHEGIGVFEDKDMPFLKKKMKSISYINPVDTKKILMLCLLISSLLLIGLGVFLGVYGVLKNIALLLVLGCVLVALCVVIGVFSGYGWSRSTEFRNKEIILRRRKIRHFLKLTNDILKERGAKLVASRYTSYISLKIQEDPIFETLESKDSGGRRRKLRPPSHHQNHQGAPNSVSSRLGRDNGAGYRGGGMSQCYREGSVVSITDRASFRNGREMINNNNLRMMGIRERNSTMLEKMLKAIEEARDEQETEERGLQDFDEEIGSGYGSSSRIPRDYGGAMLAQSGSTGRRMRQNPFNQYGDYQTHQSKEYLEDLRQKRSGRRVRLQQTLEEIPERDENFRPSEKKNFGLDIEYDFCHSGRQHYGIEGRRSDEEGGAPNFSVASELDQLDERVVDTDGLNTESNRHNKAVIKQYSEKQSSKIDLAEQTHGSVKSSKHFGGNSSSGRNGRKEREENNRESKRTFGNPPGPTELDIGHYSSCGEQIDNDSIDKRFNDYIRDKKILKYSSSPLKEVKNELNSGTKFYENLDKVAAAAITKGLDFTQTEVEAGQIEKKNQNQDSKVNLGNGSGKKKSCFRVLKTGTREFYIPVEEYITLQKKDNAHTSTLGQESSNKIKELTNKTKMKLNLMHKSPSRQQFDLQNKSNDQLSPLGNHPNPVDTVRNQDEGFMNSSGNGNGGYKTVREDFRKEELKDFSSRTQDRGHNLQVLNESKRPRGLFITSCDLKIINSTHTSNQSRSQKLKAKLQQNRKQLKRASINPPKAPESPHPSNRREPLTPKRDKNLAISLKPKRKLEISPQQQAQNRINLLNMRPPSSPRPGCDIVSLMKSIESKNLSSFHSKSPARIQPYSPSMAPRRVTLSGQKSIKGDLYHRRDNSRQLVGGVDAITLNQQNREKIVSETQISEGIIKKNTMKISLRKKSIHDVSKENVAMNHQQNQPLFRDLRETGRASQDRHVLKGKLQIDTKGLVKNSKKRKMGSWRVSNDGRRIQKKGGKSNDEDRKSGKVSRVSRSRGYSRFNGLSWNVDERYLEDKSGISPVSGEDVSSSESGDRKARVIERQVVNRDVSGGRQFKGPRISVSRGALMINSLRMN